MSMLSDLILFVKIQDKKMTAIAVIDYVLINSIHYYLRKNESVISITKKLPAKIAIRFKSPLIAV